MREAWLHARSERHAPGRASSPPLARALTRKRDFEGAAAAYGRALEIDPAQAVVLNSLGIVYRHLGRFDEALAAQEKAIEAKPEFTRARFLRAVLLLAAGRFEEGFEAFLSRPLGASRPARYASIPTSTGCSVRRRPCSWEP